MTSEREFYDQCSLYTSTKRTITECENRSFVLLEIVENEKNVLASISIVDPAIKVGGMGSEKFFKLKTPQQVAVQILPILKKRISGLIEKFLLLKQVSDESGMSVEDVGRLCLSSNNAEEFYAKIKEQGDE